MSIPFPEIVGPFALDLPRPLTGSERARIQLAARVAAERALLMVLAPPAPRTPRRRAVRRNDPTR